MKLYALTNNKAKKLLTAESSLAALIEESAELKKNGQTHFTLEISKEGQKLGVWVR